ncbi:hypothetical protein LXG23DRAFT_36388 [Yarrowia lipolytica]|nr:hypothetical protein BKA91DRAFT_163004 [Yarrowia lipolytica]KAE8170701.1 hypothetical protein BKA90DRAFT_158399 [Yarrowia lipolytica]KAJ8054283.1 hypothetical protein LXG23DRAFT_36388 [Yarrowia lipolytica]RMI97274.1 hypothetical protein BD777DRAFT_153191 [Yarrowia lipolytica]
MVIATVLVVAPVFRTVQGSVPTMDQTLDVTLSCTMYRSPELVSYRSWVISPVLRSSLRSTPLGLVPALFGPEGFKKQFLVWEQAIQRPAESRGRSSLSWYV